MFSNRINAYTGENNGKNCIDTNQGVKEGCNLLSSFFNVNSDTILMEQTHNWNNI
jgi:hypothetical protein